MELRNRDLIHETTQLTNILCAPFHHLQPLSGILWIIGATAVTASSLESEGPWMVKWITWMMMMMMVPLFTSNLTTLDTMDAADRISTT